MVAGISGAGVGVPRAEAGLVDNPPEAVVEGANDFTKVTEAVASAAELQIVSVVVTRVDELGVKGGVPKTVPLVQEKKDPVYRQVSGEPSLLTLTLG